MATLRCGRRLDGVGIARLPVTAVSAPIGKRQLVPLLQDWAPRPVGFYLYYSSRRQVPAALRTFVDFLKAHGKERSAA